MVMPGPPSGRPLPLLAPLMRALFPGSFDPVTPGHQDVLRRASLLFDEVVVCVMFNANKTGRFPVAEAAGAAPRGGGRAGQCHGRLAHRRAAGRLLPPGRDRGRRPRGAGRQGSGLRDADGPDEP
ncbi:adenylyltransferase/cytidyltransferase family protein [Streptomyces griseofuscus]|uniref:adenylyltransferase/cytidyltransferase family protein n=1 Tax=Streptomyces griseofuscus TaxID=146922 RepID=UPI0037F4B91D